MRQFKLISLAAALFILSSATVSAQNWNVEQVSSLYDFWGSCQDVAIQGNFAYLANYSSGLCVVDISDPTAPVAIGDLDFSKTVDLLSVSGNYACLKAVGFGFIMVDISDPDSLVELSCCPVTGIQHVVLLGQYLYVSSFYNGLYIFDVSEPSSPALVGRLRMPYHTRDVTVSGDYAYVTVLDYGLFVVDVTDPTEPSFTGFIRIECGGYQDIEYDDGLVYVLSGSGVCIVDVGNPGSPLLISQITTGYGPNGITKSGQYVYVASGSYGVHIIDVANPYQPSLVNTYSTPGHAYDLWVADNILYLADSESFRIYRVADPLSPEEIGILDSSGFIRAVEKRGDLIYLGDYNNGLRIVDAADPASPFELSNCFNPFSVHVCNLAVTDAFAYLACHENGLTIIDITAPSAPSFVSNYALQYCVEDVEIVGNLAYLANYNSGLRILDISDPYDPVQIGICATPDWANAVAISGNYAYVGAWGFFLVVDISNPSHPFIVSQTGYYPGMVKQVEVQGNYAYLVGLQTLMQIIDISNPHHPREVFEKESDNYQSVLDIALEGDFAFLSTDFAGLQVLNISDPTRPVVVGYHQLTNSSMGLVVDSIYAYLADMFHFEIFDCSEAIAPPIDIVAGNNRSNAEIHTIDFTASPNPFNPATTLSFALPKASRVCLSVYDVSGRLVATLVDGWRDAGVHEVTFDGSSLASGVYIYRLQAGTYHASGKMVLMK